MVKQIDIATNGFFLTKEEWVKEMDFLLQHLPTMDQIRGYARTLEDEGPEKMREIVKEERTRLNLGKHLPSMVQWKLSHLFWLIFDYGLTHFDAAFVLEYLQQHLKKYEGSTSSNQN